MTKEPETAEEYFSEIITSIEKADNCFMGFNAAHTIGRKLKESHVGFALVTNYCFDFNGALEIILQLIQFKYEHLVRPYSYTLVSDLNPNSFLPMNFKVLDCQSIVIELQNEKEKYIRNIESAFRYIHSHTGKGWKDYFDKLQSTANTVENNFYSLSYAD